MSSRTIHASSIADNRFFPGLAAAFASALISARPGQSFHFHILDGGIDRKSIHALRASLNRIAERDGKKALLECHSIPEESLLSLPKRRNSRMTFAKFVLPDLFNELDSIIHLDADVLYLRGLDELDQDDNAILLTGVQDYIGRLGNDCPWSHTLTSEEKNLPYINAGVMWMNLKAIRAENFILDAIRLRASTKGMARGDQPVWNYFCRGRIKILSTQNNYCISLGSSKRLVKEWNSMNLHFIGPSKPWSGRPKTHQHFAFTLWHYFVQTHIPELGLSSAKLPLSPSIDLRSYRNKSMIYRFVNPKRASHYQHAVNSHEASIRLNSSMF